MFNGPIVFSFLGHTWEGKGNVGETEEVHNETGCLQPHYNPSSSAS